MGRGRARSSRILRSCGICRGAGRRRRSRLRRITRRGWSAEADPTILLAMAKSSIPPPGVAIASLDARKTQILNLMAPGPGTAWEDRGSIGVFGAFFKTAFKSMFKPAQLLDSIRRPETGGDSFSFALGCGVMWALSALLHGYIYYHHMLGV